MKHISNFIVEKLDIPDDVKVEKPAFTPANKEELRKILKEKLIKGDTYLNDIDTSLIKDMSHLFKGLEEYATDLIMSGWDVSNVTDMNSMFKNCKLLDTNLKGWNVSNVTDMFAMFFNCEKFDSDLSKWNVSKNQSFKSMFYNCKNFTGDVSNWNIDNGSRFEYMFFGCEKNKSDITGWNKKNDYYLPNHDTYIVKGSKVKYKRNTKKNLY